MNFEIISSAYKKPVFILEVAVATTNSDRVCEPLQLRFRVAVVQNSAVTFGIMPWTKSFSARMISTMVRELSSSARSGARTRA